MESRFNPSLTDAESKRDWRREEKKITVQMGRGLTDGAS